MDANDKDVVFYDFCSMYLDDHENEDLRRLKDLLHLTHWRCGNHCKNHKLCIDPSGCRSNHHYMRGALPTTFYGVSLRCGHVRAALQAVSRKWFGCARDERCDARSLLEKYRGIHTISTWAQMKQKARRPNSGAIKTKKNQPKKLLKKNLQHAHPSAAHPKL